MPLNILFLCSRNKWRSPTGERAWARTPGVAARSAGTSRSARRRVTSADVIFVMEEKHKTALKAGFRNEITPKTVHVLDIPDDYQFMDPDLVDSIVQATEPIVYKEIAARK